MLFPVSVGSCALSILSCTLSVRLILCTLFTTGGRLGTSVRTEPRQEPSSEGMTRVGTPWLSSTTAVLSSPTVIVRLLVVSSVYPSKHFNSTVSKLASNPSSAVIRCDSYASHEAVVLEALIEVGNVKGLLAPLLRQEVLLE